MRFYFSECAVTLYYVDSSPDNAAEIIACVTDVNSEIAIPLVNDGHNLTTLASLAGSLRSVRVIVSERTLTLLTSHKEEPTSTSWFTENYGR